MPDRLSRGPRHRTTVHPVLKLNPIARVRWFDTDRERDIRTWSDAFQRCFLVGLDPQTHPVMLVTHRRVPLTQSLC